jgi:putative DNA primase/helicase
MLEDLIVIPSREEERELREGLRARGFAADAIDTYITVDEAREIIRSITPEKCVALRARGGPGDVLALHTENGEIFIDNVAREEALKRFGGGTTPAPKRDAPSSPPQRPPPAAEPQSKTDGGEAQLEPDREAALLESDHAAPETPEADQNYLNPHVDLKTLSIPLIKFPGLKHAEPEREFICTGLSELVAEIAPDPTPMIWYKHSVPYYIAGTLKAAELVGKTRERAVRERRPTFGKQRSNSHIDLLGPAIFLDDDGDVFAREPRLRTLGAAAIIYSSHSYGSIKDGTTKPAKGGRVVPIVDRSVTPDEYRAVRDGLEHLLGGGFDENASSISHCYGRHVRRSVDAPCKRVIIDGAAFSADALIELGRSLRPQRQYDSPEARKTPQGHKRALAEELERIKLMGAVRPLDDYVEWMSAAAACKRAFPDDEEAAFICFNTLSACSPPELYKDANAARKKFDEVPVEYDGDKIPVDLGMLHTRTKRRALEVIRVLYSLQHETAADPTTAFVDLAQYKRAGASAFKSTATFANLDPDQGYSGEGIDDTYPKGGEPIPPGSLKPEDGLTALEYLLFCWSEKALEGLHVPQRELEGARRRTEERRKNLNLDGEPQGGGDTTAYTEIARLAALSTVEYERAREPVAKKLEMRVSSVDKLVAKKRAQLASGDGGLEDAVALKFSAKYKDSVRYVAAWNKWFIWDGTCWREEETLSAYDLARPLCREVGDAKAKTVAAVIALARTDRRQAAVTSQWDADPWLLGTPQGIVDLRAGKLLPPDPTAYITKTTGVAPSEKADCPLWFGHLDKVTRQDKDLQAYLKRMAGYCLTGVTSEHTLFFLFGTGRNGKGVFTGTLADIWRDYYEAAAMDMFIVSKFQNHPTDLASLRGARLVGASETEEGRRWDEAKLKTLTGGGTIPARFMRQDFFRYTPQFKLMIDGNHKPSIRSVDEAIKARMGLTPFTVFIPPAERIKDFAEMLRPEHPAILQWAIEGCLEWQRLGLQPPRAVTEATASYMAAQDVLQSFLDECCVVAPNESDTIEHIYDGYTDWAETCREFVWTKRDLCDRLENTGFTRHRFGRDRTKGFIGLRCIRENARKLMEAAKRKAEEMRREEEEAARRWQDRVAGNEENDRQDKTVPPITAWEIDELKTRGFTPNDLFGMSPESARTILADPDRNKLTETYGKGTDAPPETICQVCKKPGARYFGEPNTVGMKAEQASAIYPLHLECCPTFFDSTVPWD